MYSEIKPNSLATRRSGDTLYMTMVPDGRYQESGNVYLSPIYLCKQSQITPCIQVPQQITKRRY